MDIYDLINQSTQRDREAFCSSLSARTVVGHGGSAGAVHELCGEWEGFEVRVTRKKQLANNLLFFEYNNLLALYDVPWVPRPVLAKPPYLYLEFVPGLSLDNLTKRQWGMLDADAFAGNLLHAWWLCKQMGYTHTDFHLHNVVVSTATMLPYIIDWRHCELNCVNDKYERDALRFCSKVHASIVAHGELSPCLGVSMLSEHVGQTVEERKWWQVWKRVAGKNISG